MNDYVKKIYESNDGDLFAIRKALVADYYAGNEVANDIVTSARNDVNALPFTDGAKLINDLYNRMQI